MFIVAELPATTSDPNEFIADWITTFESEKIVPCNPAGIPMAISLLICMGLSLNRNVSALTLRFFH